MRWTRADTQHFFSFFWLNSSIVAVIHNQKIIHKIERGAFDSVKNHKRQRRKSQSLTAEREKLQTPKFV